MAPRPTRLISLTIALAIAASTAGCADMYYDRRETISLQTGDAVASNRAAQMIDPWPPEAADRNIPANGGRMQRAIDRYRNNRTTPLATTNTSSAQYVPVMAPAPGGGSGGGSGGSNQ
jgi:type IV pilus biogenesis protein CpaD/CtpE